MARITVAEARKICTPAELGLLLACRPKQLERLSQEQLKTNVDSARRLRDKWRDLATEQRRQTQRKQQARVTEANARSREKAALFAHALAKFDAQLKKVAADGGPGKSAPVVKKTVKSQRTTAHREERAAVRDSLKAARREINAASADAKPPAKKKTAKKAVKKAAKKPPVAAAAKSALKKAPAKKASSPKKAAPVKKKGVKKAAPAATKPAKKAAKAPQKAGLVAADPRQQRSAGAAAKKSRLKAGGLLARIRGHVSARGRRAQGKRDARD